VYCLWDGEEQGLLGSTEWAEQHAAELRRKAVAYLNSDSTGRGYLRAEGSHTLEKFINEIARDIRDPEKDMSVWKRAQLMRILRSPQERQELRRSPDLRIGALGSGSDYTAFIDHLGVASLNLGYSGLDGGGIYHSIYDDFYWYTQFADSDFQYVQTLSQTIGTAAMRLANAEVLPFAFTNFADTVRRYTSELQALLKDKRADLEERNRQIEEGVFTATADRKEKFVPPSAAPLPPHLNFAPLENALEALERSAGRYETALAKAGPLPQAAQASLNAKLIQSERRLTDPAGLPRRPWFQHQIYAPGWYTGYGVKTIPAVREAIEQNRWEEAEAEIARVGKILTGFASLVDSAAVELEAAAR
jgi:N-acetylated-alpha-linked acidic dipeptidase